jgi:hypothetical protein
MNKMFAKGPYGYSWCGEWIPYTNFDAGIFGTRVYRPEDQVGRLGIVYMPANLWVSVMYAQPGKVLITAGFGYSGNFAGIFSCGEIAEQIEYIFRQAGATDLVGHAAEIMCGAYTS